ncbi:hypothetical protein NDU88_001719 [Pleurodeles waltl]|uniref:Uncharacterized protein n=1 Tax=Pleurodeles waltl TaxID=8319 RepID=A0AAV7MLA9_PLEWA|nr:hypothetical protein NDU88_001719 [Pleurodeles waltl]
MSASGSGLLRDGDPLRVFCFYGGAREAKDLAGARDASEHGVVPLLRASVELFRVREAAARVPYRGNQGRASTEPDPSERQEEVNAVQDFQPVGEDQGNTIVDMLKALSVELKGGFEMSNANQVEIRGLCEDLGKKIDDLAGHAAALEDEVGELRMVMEENKEQIRYLKEAEAGILHDWAVLWYEVRKITRLSYYMSEYVPIWDSPGSPEWTKDTLAIPLKEAGFVQRTHLCYNGELREFDNLNMEVGGRLSKFNYLQMKTWGGNVTEEVGSTNGLVYQMQLDTPMKKEVAKWYWLMIDIVDGEFNLPEEI